MSLDYSSQLNWPHPAEIEIEGHKEDMGKADSFELSGDMSKDFEGIFSMRGVNGDYSREGVDSEAKIRSFVTITIENSGKYIEKLKKDASSLKSQGKEGDALVINSARLYVESRQRLLERFMARYGISSE
ncbi:MAG TPA: hypothetical protein VGC58_01585 [Candidatus Paceibacterota bacterium]